MQFTRESIFVSSIRFFCTSFAALLGISLSLFVITSALYFISKPNIFPAKSEVVIAPDAYGQRNLLPHSTPAILRLDICGVIGSLDLTTEKFENLLLDSREDLLGDNRVKGILLYINSPGGVASDADAMYRALMTYKKKYGVPIYAYVEGLCASGGMYIACAADKIYTSPESLIGSVGVILGPTFNFTGTMEKIGMQALTLTEGKDKDMLNPFRRWQPGEDYSLRVIMGDLYTRFVDIVAASRPRIDKEKLIEEYGAQMFFATKAQELGFVDEANSNYSEALSALAASANISSNEAYQVFKLETPHAFLADLIQGKNDLLKGEITHTFPLGSFLNSGMSGKFLYLYSP